jgi:hypothetical protein
MCEHVRSCVVLGEKGNTPKDSWRNGFMLKGYAQCVFAWDSNKMKAFHEHRKTHDLINKKRLIWQRKSCGILSQITNKTETSWNRKIKKFCRYDWTEVVMFWQNKNRLHSSTVVQFPFGSFCRNAGLCWGSWPCLPLISSGWVVVGVWTKMIDQLEETSPELFFQYLLE